MTTTSMASAVKGARKHLSKLLGKEVSQSEFGKMCGFSNAQSRVSNYETGRREPGLEDAMIICKTAQMEWKEFIKKTSIPSGYDAKDLESAFNNLSINTTLMPKNFVHTVEVDVENALIPFPYHKDSAYHKDKGKSLAVIRAEEDCNKIRHGALMTVDTSCTEITKKGYWCIKINNVGVPVEAKIDVNGTPQSEELGSLKKAKVIGRVVALYQDL